MGKKLVSRTAKILSETRKTKDKEAVAVAYEHIPRDPNEQKHGSLYAVIEVEDGGGNAEVLVEGIIDDFHNEYYSDVDRDPLSSFESALTKVNEGLAEKSGEGHINWLGKLNAVLGVLSESTLHLTQSGRAEAYLIRGEHSSHITDDLSGDPINPLRTFINIASGELAENDKVVMTTPGIFYKISKDELKKYVTESAPKVAVENISQLLSGENKDGAPSSVLIMEMVSPESFASAPGAEAPGEVWIKDEKKPLEPVAQGALKGTAKAFDVIGKAASGAAAFITTKAVPAIKTGAGKIKSVAKSFRKEKDAEKIILESEEKIGETRLGSTENLELDEETTSGILEEPKESAELTNEIRIKESDHKPKRLSLERFDFSFATKTKDNISSFFKKFRLPGGKNSFIYLVVGALLIIGLIGYFVISGTNKKADLAAENLFSQAKTKYETALSEISSGQGAQALEDLDVAEKLANDAAKTKQKKTDAEKLLSDINAARDQARGVVRNTANEFFNFSDSGIGGFYSDGNLYYAVNFENGTTYSLDPKAKTKATIIETPNIDGKIKFATIIPKSKVIVAYTDTKNLYEINLTAKKVNKQTVDGGLEDAVAIASYGTNIYLLSPGNNQVYKHLKTTSGYGRKSNYVTKAAGDELASDISLGIDSDVYTTGSNGLVKKYTAGTRKDYAISGKLTEFENISGIFVSAGVKGLYLSSADKVIKIDASGNFVAQYVSDSVKSIKNIVADDTSNTIYALSEGKIYSISY